jgi:hypothetical protein
MDEKVCKGPCQRQLPLSMFYQFKNEQKIRWEPICKECKKALRKRVEPKELKKNVKPQVEETHTEKMELAFYEEKELPSSNEKAPQAMAVNSDSIKYKLKNGEEIEFKKEEFTHVVGFFKLLYRQQKKLKNSEPIADNGEVTLFELEKIAG